MLRRLGRGVLWCFVAVLLIRGAADLLVREQPAAAVRGPVVVPGAWHDDEAKAFAVQFARAYLNFSPREPERSADEVRAFVAPEIADAVVPQYGEDAEPQVVGSVLVARSSVVDNRHALVTVAVDGARYLTVPVARDSWPANARSTSSPLGSISSGERTQLRHNRYVIVRNPRDPGRRRFLIGSTDGGRVLTLVIEQTWTRRRGRS